MAKYAEAYRVMSGEMQYREARFQPGSYDAETRTLDVLWTTGADVERYAWDGSLYLERLSFEPGAINLVRLNSGRAPFLRQHRGDIDNTLGVVVADSIRFDNQNGYAKVRLSSAEADAGVVGKILDGILTNISVGYLIAEEAEIKEKGQPLVRLAQRWEPYELSLVAMGADAGASVRELQHSIGEDKMDKEMEVKAQPVAAEDVDTARAEGVQSERARISQIAEAARRLGVDATAGQELIDAGVTLDVARSMLIDMRAEKDKIVVSHPVVEVVAAEADKRREAYVSGMYARMHPSARVVTDGLAGEIRGMRIGDVAKRALEDAGVNTGKMTRYDIARAALMGRAGGFHTTSDFPFLMGDLARKSLMSGYTAVPNTFANWTRQVNLPDTLTHNLVSFGEFATLSDIPEGGEFPQVTAGEAKEAWKLQKSGARFAYTVEMLLNDETDALSRMPMMFGASAQRKQGDVVYALLTANGDMSDGIPLFDALHSNVGTAGVPTATAIAELQKLMRVQTGLDGTEVVGVPMRFVIVPEILRFTVAQLLGGAYVPTSAGAAVTADQLGLTIVSDPRLDAHSAAHWYGAASPAEMDTVVYGFLDGENGPVLEDYADPDHDAYILKVRQFFAAKPADWRGLVYNAG